MQHQQKKEPFYHQVLLVEQDMIQNYQDAMVICSWVGYPDLFIMFTCNHNCPKLVDFLRHIDLG